MKKFRETLPCFPEFYYIRVMDVIKIIQGGGHRSSPGRRSLMIKTRVHVPDQLVLRVHARIPEWCRCPDPVTVPKRASAAYFEYRCSVIRNENAADGPPGGKISPALCVRCRFCGFYGVRDMIACRRMWDTMDFYVMWDTVGGPGTARRIGRPDAAVPGPEPAEFMSMWRRGKRKITGGPV